MTNSIDGLLNSVAPELDPITKCPSWLDLERRAVAEGVPLSTLVYDECQKFYKAIRFDAKNNEPVEVVKIQSPILMYAQRINGRRPIKRWRGETLLVVGKQNQTLLPEQSNKNWKKL